MDISPASVEDAAQRDKSAGKEALQKKFHLHETAQFGREWNEASAQKKTLVAGPKGTGIHMSAVERHDF